ncbi:MAG: FAD-dependent oxidoreductase [candidate division Zixibacteria bacterium]|nr:FAD-dependent oxidoreductase [candidate division Zixibacteria bacterium]
MPEQSYTYIIVGAGLAGGCAADAIRQSDKKGSVLLVGDEKHLPYDRPDLSKKLWFGKKKLEQIFLHDQKFYDEHEIQVTLGSRIVEVDAKLKSVKDDKGNTYRYDKLLLATGGIPRTLPIPGGDIEGICYYRYLDDYLRIRTEAKEGKSAVVIGGGFIGSEIAAALNINKVNVTMVFPEPYLVQRVFPDYLGKAIQQHYIERGIKILNGDKPSSIYKNGVRFLTQTSNGKQVESDLLIVGIGIMPVIDLAQQAGLKVGNGIVVNEYLQTSDPNIYAAGDNAYFPYQALGQNMRVEHWDNAVNQGKWAGRNMAGAHEQFDYMPYFYSDLFEFGYEAVGEVDSQLETFADWQKENDTGVIYYLKEGKVRGLMMCNVWGKVDAARELIKKGERVRPESLAGIIR